MRRKIKCGGRARRKAALGADGAIMAAATLTAAGMNVAATMKSASDQARATVDSAKTQAKSIEAQTKNNTELQKQALSVQAQQKQEERDLMNDMNMTMQMMAGRQNMNDMLNASRLQAKYGGKGARKNKKRSKLKAMQPSYGGATNLVETTDGGNAVPIAIDENGYGIYELRGDNHKQYHKTKGGKYKSGVGVRTSSGEVVEGEGSKTYKPGELYVKDYDDDYFLSRHNINGFNPTDAVLAGMNPREAFIIQEMNKETLGVNDDGSKAKYGGRCHKLKYGGRPKAYMGMNMFGVPVGRIVGGGSSTIGIGLNPNSSSPVGSNTSNNSNTRSGGMGGYTGAIVGAGANLIGAGLNWLGNHFAGRKMARANQQAGDIIANAYNNLKTIDMDFVDKKLGLSEEAPQVLAAIRDPHIITKPMEERINRDARYERRMVNDTTMSSAARQQRLAAINDRGQQRLGELAANANAQREAVLDKNMEAINQASMANVNSKIQWQRDNNALRLDLAKYNNDIENTKITGAAQAQADAIMGASQARSSATLAGWSGLGQALTSGAAGFASTYDGLRQERQNWLDVMAGATNEGQINAAIGRNDKIGRDYAYQQYRSYMAILAQDPTNKVAREYANRLKAAYNFV